jgi:integrase
VTQTSLALWGMAPSTQGQVLAPPAPSTAPGCFLQPPAVLWTDSPSTSTITPTKGVLFSSPPTSGSHQLFPSVFPQNLTPLTSLSSSTPSWRARWSQLTSTPTKSVSVWKKMILPLSTPTPKLILSPTQEITLVPSVSLATPTASLSIPQVSPPPNQDFLSPLPCDGPLGHLGEVLSLDDLKKRARSSLQEFAWSSVSQSTAKAYKAAWEKFTKFGKKLKVEVNQFLFDYTFVCEYLLYKLHFSGSVSSVLSARSAITFFWKINSDSSCPCENKFVTLFVKGLQRKFKKPIRKSYPISYKELSFIFSKIVGDSEIENLSFINLRFITMLLTLYSSFSRFEEIINLKLDDISREEAGFILTFRKGKSYQFGESHIGIVSNLTNLAFNPSRIFSIYLDRVALLHSKSDHSGNLLFPICKVVKSVETSLPKPISYNEIKKQFTVAVTESNINVGFNKIGLHCMRRGSVTSAVRAGADHDIVMKAMRVKSRSNVGYYATLQGSDLAETSKLAF